MSTAAPSKVSSVWNFGRPDLLAAHLDALLRSPRGERATPAALRVGEVRAVSARERGPMLVARTLWRELGLDAIPGGHGARSRVRSDADVEGMVA